jgi:glutathione S-transferase
MTDTRLYCFAESGNAYKAALMFALTNTPWDAVHVDFFKGEARSDAFKEINPMGEVPVMVYGGETYAQSGVMLDVLSRDTGQFGPKSETDRLEILRWTLWDNHKLSSQVGMTRFLMNFLPEKHRNADVIAFSQGRCKTAYAVLENHLNGRDWVAADYPTTADISCCCYLYYPEEFGFDRADYPNIDAWLKRVSELPNWKHPYDLMERAYSHD